jgi:hypothetical protein
MILRFCATRTDRVYQCLLTALASKGRMTFIYYLIFIDLDLSPARTGQSLVGVVALLASVDFPHLVCLLGLEKKSTAVELGTSEVVHR